MRILVACEFSGTVREAFRARGHDAWSCDLLPAEDGSEFHIEGDAQCALEGTRVYGTPYPTGRGIIVSGGKNAQPVAEMEYPSHLEPWDLLLGHPPCTFLCNSGVRWLAPGGILNPSRHALMQAACDFFAALYHAPVARVCIENPVMHKYARDYLQSAWKVPTFSQSIQPWQFGHGETKRTCLWLRGLPLLQPTHRKADLFCAPEPSERTPRVHHASPGADRWKERSRTLKGIAEAMAEQWSA